MRYRRFSTLIGMTAWAALATACTTTRQGQPQPNGTSETSATGTSIAAPPSSTSQSTGQLPSDGAPKVKNPLDTGSFQQSPCQILTVAQTQELNLSAQGEPGEGPLGLACAWSNRDTGGRIRIQWAVKDGRGLSGDYAAHNAGRWAYFIEYPDIEGFPGVASDLFDDRAKGACAVSVGVSDQVIFQAELQLSLRNSGRRIRVRWRCRWRG